MILSIILIHDSFHPGFGFLCGLTPWQKNVDKSSCDSIFLCGGFGAGREGREEVHFKCLGEFHRRAEGDVDVAGHEFPDVGARDVHALRKRGLVQPHPLHLLDAAPQKRANHVIYSH